MGAYYALLIVCLLSIIPAFIDIDAREKRQNKH